MSGGDEEPALKENVVLIGMPGCGKSTVGVVLAKALGYGFIDSDLVIQAREKRLLHEIIEQEGTENFNRIEEEVNASLEASRAVIATGGSVVYGPRAMKHLKDIGTVIYLKLPLAVVRNRLGNLAKRGVSLRKGQTLADLYEERTPLYEKYADMILDAEGLTLRRIVAVITARLEEDI